MAIKISGTTVVDDNRGLTNVATVDATTATAIGNAGIGGGGIHDFVATGTIANGDVVILNSDGTVSVVESSVDSAATPVELGTRVLSTSAAYDTNTQKVVIVYRDQDNSNYGTAVVGTVSGTSISFGSPVVFNSATTVYTATTYDASAQKVVIAYQNIGNSSYGTAIVGTVSGTSISFGSPTVFQASATYDISTTYDTNTQKVVIAYTDSSNGTAIVGTVSGTSISFGSSVIFNSGGRADLNSATYDSNTQKVVIAYQDAGNADYGTAIVGTVSGTSISFGSPVVFNGASTHNLFAAYDPNAHSVVIAYEDVGNSEYGTAIVGAVNGTSISFGSPVIFQASAIHSVVVTYDVNAQKAVISYRDAVNSYRGIVIVGTVSGTSISFGSPIVFNNSNSSHLSSTYDESAQKVIITYKSTTGESVVFSTGFNNPTSENYIGVAAEDISNTATGEVTIIGGVNEQAVNSYDLANASYDSVSFSVAGQETIPRGLFFKPDGTKMYVVGQADDEVLEYDLSTAWGISTASYLQAFSVGTQEAFPAGIFFKTDGTKMYITGPAGDDVNEYTLSTAWDITTASYSQNFSVASQDTTPLDLSFKSDGTKMYFVGGTNDAVYEYNLSTAWDISTASYSQNFSLSSQITENAQGLSFKPDGTKMYVVGQYNASAAYEYSLSTAWDVSSASFVQSFSVLAQDANMQALSFKADGTKMYILGSTNGAVFQYSTGTFNGYDTNTSYFVADDGSLTTTNNGRKIGRAISTTELQVKTKLTGSEMNAYLGGLV